MLDHWTFRLAACFTDSRPVLEVKYDIEKRVNRLLPRDLERPAALAFRAYSKSCTTPSGTTVELRLEATFENHNLYALQFDAEGPADPPKAKSWEENMRRNFGQWTSGLAMTEARAASSPDRYRQVVAETLAREADCLKKDDNEAIRAVQEAILEGLHRGRTFSTAHHEGGTHIHFLGTSFVLQDYGESNDREEFASSAGFLARLRRFYDSEARRDWFPHTPPEIEAWRFIERQLKDYNPA